MAHAMLADHWSSLPVSLYVHVGPLPSHLCLPSPNPPVAEALAFFFSVSKSQTSASSALPRLEPVLDFSLIPMIICPALS